MGVNCSTGGCISHANPRTLIKRLEFGKWGSFYLNSLASQLQGSPVQFPGRKDATRLWGDIRKSVLNFLEAQLFHTALIWEFS
jgi:hypothetical protein